MLEEIKAKRELMINCANKYGFTNDETIRYSQELDELINKYQRAYGKASRQNEEVIFSLKQMTLIWPKALIEL
jgi:stage 0 sporulation regulatory protein